MHHFQLHAFRGLVAIAISLLSYNPSAVAQPAAKGPIKALLITGGCCHNYKFQAQALTEGINKWAPADPEVAAKVSALRLGSSLPGSDKRAVVEWTIVNEGGTGTKAQIGLYSSPDWAKPYDVIIHNECFADTDDADYIRRITAAHKAGKPALVIHCAMHTYRAWKSDDWREFLGVTSRHHEHQSRYPVRIVAPEHPIMKGIWSSWTTPMDELYVIEKLWPTAKALAVSKSEKTGQEQPVVWANNYYGTRVFGTTYGHSDDTFGDPVFIDLLARGFFWAAGTIK